MGNKITIETELDKSEKIFISSVPKNRTIVPAFICIGANDHYSTPTPNYPGLFDVLIDLSKSGTWLLWTLIRKRNLKTNKTWFKPANKKEETRVTRAYKEISEHQLVCRIRRELYLINPKIAIPQFDDYYAVMDQWMTLIKEVRGEEIK